MRFLLGLLAVLLLSGCAVRIEPLYPPSPVGIYYPSPDHDHGHHHGHGHDDDED